MVALDPVGIRGTKKGIWDQGNKALPSTHRLPADRWTMPKTVDVGLRGDLCCLWVVLPSICVCNTSSTSEERWFLGDGVSPR